MSDLINPMLGIGHGDTSDVSEHYNSRTYFCAFCDEVLEDKRKAFDHHIWHLNDSYDCKECSIDFKDFPSLEQHFNTVHNSVNITSVLPPIVEEWISNFLENQSTYFNESSDEQNVGTQLICQICEKYAKMSNIETIESFDSLWKVKLHLCKHFNWCPMKCLLCEKNDNYINMFPNHSYLMIKHLIEYHFTSKDNINNKSFIGQKAFHQMKDQQLSLIKKHFYCESGNTVQVMNVFFDNLMLELEVIQENQLKMKYKITKEVVIEIERCSDIKREKTKKKTEVKNKNKKIKGFSVFIKKPISKRSVIKKINNRKLNRNNKCHWPKCQFKAGSKFHLKEHMSHHFGHKPHRCLTCNKCFTQYSHLISHKLYVHSNKKRFVCSVSDCNKRYKTRDYLNRHIKEIHSNVKYRCNWPKCNQVFSRKGYLPEHMRSHTGEKPFKCDECGLKFPKKYRLERHKNSRHSDSRPFKCTIKGCDSSYKTKRGLEYHIKRHSGIKPLKCDDCGKRFLTNGELKSHQNNIHLKIKRFECNICDKKFTQSSHLTTHKRVHSGERPYECDVCDKKFKQRSCLKKHKMTHSGERPFKCDFEGCDSRFIQISQLKDHINRNHSQLRKFKCLDKDCGKSFKSQTDLGQHKQTVHSNIRQFQCNQCDKAFKTNKSLKNHKRIHSDEKPFVCDVVECGKSFRHLSNLTKHKNQHDLPISTFKCTYPGCDKKYYKTTYLKYHVWYDHEGKDKPFVCPVKGCGKGFVEKHELKAHNRIHTEEKSFKCSFDNCGKIFKLKSSLSRHLNSHNGPKNYRSSFENCKKRLSSENGLNRHKAIHLESDDSEDTEDSHN